MPSREVRVLVVDDEPRMRDLLGEVIPEMGFATTTCKSAEEALRQLAFEAREILIVDLQLTGMGGMELFERVRRDWPGMQVIVLSGFGNLDIARRAIQLNVVDFLSKPCHLRDIELALDRARRRLTPENPTLETTIAPSSTSTLAETERREILSALARTGGNRTRAAKQLGISRRTLHYRLSDYGIKG